MPLVLTLRDLGEFPVAVGPFESYLSLVELLNHAAGHASLLKPGREGNKADDPLLGDYFFWLNFYSFVSHN